MAKLLADGEIGEVMLWERVQHLEADTAQKAQCAMTRRPGAKRVISR
ncbi:MAG: hypothetical protein U0350_11485 [Caldilineaceae bacterium]